MPAKEVEMAQRRKWMLEFEMPDGRWEPFLEPERDLRAGIRMLLDLQIEDDCRIRHIETGDIFTHDQAQAIVILHLPLIPEVLEAFFAANRKALNTSTEHEVLPGSPE